MTPSEKRVGEIEERLANLEMPTPYGHSFLKHGSCVEEMIYREDTRFLLSALKASREGAEELAKALKVARSRACEAEECASGVKPHNPDGDGDEMCEEGLCFEPGWKENIKDIDAALARYDSTGEK